ncbi:MAG: hypothetical protein JO001_29390 [Alphaproteobacteria bacterium]|nr:hypothetical protein [Alphaproteobacteria bacterium]
MSSCRLSAFCVLLAFTGVLAGFTRPAAAQVTEFTITTANSQPIDGITTGPDGNLWFTEFAGNKIGRITPGGTITEFPLPTANSQPIGIVTGSDGNLWFSEQTGNRIGRVTTTGSFMEFSVPTANSGPTGVTLGSDGNVWFTELNGNKISKITPAGSITEFPLPAAGASPRGIAGGSDGNLWFTEQNGNKIGRITTVGAITEFTVTTAAGAPFGIASGPDGALYFAEFNVNKIGRITTAGAITEFTVPTAASQPRDIAAGPDGNLWFTEQTGNQIGRVSPTGGFMEYSGLTANSVPTGITLGPDRSLWFVETAGNKIGRVKTYTLTVNLGGTGSGLVTSSLTDINCSASSSQCANSFIVNDPVTLTATAAPGSTFTGWVGGGCSGTGTCMVTATVDTVVMANFTLNPSVMLSVTAAGNGSGTVTSAPSGISCGMTCNASFAQGSVVTLSAAASSSSIFTGWSGGGCSGVGACVVTLNAATTVSATFQQNGTGAVGVLAAVLPISRAVQVGVPATAFATIINTGPGTASSCTITPATGVTASFAFQTTNPATNQITGTANTPIDIPQGAAQSFVFAFTPTAAFAPTDTALNFACANAPPAPKMSGLDTLLLSASTTPIPDIVALAASAVPGYVELPGINGAGAFAVATINLGATAAITASGDTGMANLPVTVMICQTDAGGNCMAAPASNVRTTIAANATATFGLFVNGNGIVPDQPAVNRVFARFTDAGGAVRGATSVAVRSK